MKIVSVTFDYGSDRRYDILAKVLEHSVKKNCPQADFELVRIPAPKIKTFKRCFDSNTVKLREWLRVLKSTQDNCVFMDCDMLMLKDISDAFDDESFDVGYTIRDGRYATTLPMNGGMVFVRNNPAGIEFIEKWAEVNDMMFDDLVKDHGKRVHAQWRTKFGGINQAAFGYLTAKVKYSARLKKFKCSEWNACLEHWPTVNERTRVLHVKSGLRKAALSGLSVGSVAFALQRATALWRSYAAEIDLANNEEKIVVINDSLIRVEKPKKKKVIERRSRYLRKEAWL